MSMPRIYVALDNNQADHQASVVDMEGMVANHLVSILIDSSSNLNYVAPYIIDKCKMQPFRHVNTWLVQLATGTKRKVVEAIPTFQFITDGLSTRATLNILPLASYDLLIGMDWFDTYKNKLDSYHKTL
jgi:hypothetical protein